VRRFGDFYAATQALLYIFCFRWRELIINTEDRDEEDELRYFDFGETTWVPGIKETLLRTIYSKLNPLKVCSPLIVNQFARLANHLRFIYVFPLIETNKRLRLSHTTISMSSSTYNHPNRETALTARKDEKWLGLEAYFPFDPYKLPRSKRWIDGEYVEWKGVRGLDDEDEDAESETDWEGEYESGEDEEEVVETETDGEK
jgi:RNA polymerase I-specific transcription initiation factor RRN3